MTKILKPVCLVVVLAMVGVIMSAIIMPASAHYDNAIIYSNWARVMPSIDGAFGTTEWSDATVVDMLEADPANELEAYTYFKNDADYLYICVDVPDDTTEDYYDATTISFDTGHDAEYTADHDDTFMIEGGTTVHFVSDGSWGGFDQHCKPFNTGLPLHSGLAGDWGFGPSPNSGVDHRIYEYRIPLALLLASPGDTLGFGMDGYVWMGIYDDDTELGDQWPFLRWDPIDIDEYGDLVLATPQPPAANFSATPEAGEAPLTVQFRDRSTGAIDSRWWSFGDSGSTLRNPSHTYYNEGIYTVCLTVTGPGGTSTKCSDIIVESMAVAPRLSVRNLNVTPGYAQPRQEIAINANVVNEGGMWGSQTVELIINEQFEQSRSVGVAPGTAQPVSFTVYKVEPGTYQVDIEGATGTFYVMEEPAPPATPKPGGLLAGGELDTGGIIAIIVIGAILVGGMIVLVLLTRRT